MTEPTKPNRGGHPRNPAAPVDAAATRHLIAVETVKAKPRQRTLQYLYRLLKSFVAAESQAVETERVRLLAEQVKIQSDLLEQRKEDYRRRRELGLERRQESKSIERGNHEVH